MILYYMLCLNESAARVFPYTQCIRTEVFMTILFHIFVYIYKYCVRLINAEL